MGGYLVKHRGSLVVLLCALAPICAAGGCRRDALPAVTSSPTSTLAAADPTPAQAAPTEVRTPTPPAATAERSVPQPTDLGPQLGDWDDREPFETGLVAEAQGILDGLQGATVYHISLEIADDRGRVSGQQTVFYSNREEEALDEVYFRLFPNAADGEATVSWLKVDGVDLQPQLEFRNSALRVGLPRPLEPGETAVIEMAFDVRVPTERGGHFGLFGYTDGVLALDEVYPMIPVYDDEGWNVESSDHVGDWTYLDASFYLVTVRAASELTLVASGVAVSEQASDGMQEVTFAAGPARDFYLAASDRYVRISAEVGGTTVNSYAFPEHADSSAFALQVATSALGSFNDRFGLYPYTELDLLAIPMSAGGIEYPGAIGMALLLYDESAVVSGLPARAILESATAHEVGHQWFYNVVGNDQVDDPWLDEAIVQYITWLYYVDAYGENAAQGYRDSWVGRWERVDLGDIPIGLSARDYEPANYGAIVYGRGPLFVEALAEEMGRDTFDAFLRDYYQSNLWSIGTPESFQTQAEEHCSCDLDDLFEEWVY
jgi:hypothetical protein